MSTKNRLFMMLLLFGNIVYAIPSRKDPSFLYARRNGADVKINLKVVDDEGLPVENANVHVLMGMNFRDKAYFIDGNTDTNGVFTINGKTTGNEIEFEVTKERYYKSFSKECYIKIGEEHNVVNGKWMPFPVQKRIVLRKKRNPIHLESVPFWKYRNTKAINQWIGYDIAKSDFVAPFGSGDVVDFEVFINWDGQWLPNFSGMEVKIRFTTQHAGYYLYDANRQSDFTGPYAADPNDVYLQEAVFYEYINSDGTRRRYLFDRSKCWVVRSRCKTDINGNLIEANYSVVTDISFSCKDSSIGLFRFLGAMNTTVNDRNLEWDMKNNLCPTPGRIRLEP